MIERIEQAVDRIADLWLLYWDRHAGDEAYSRPHWC